MRSRDQRFPAHAPPAPGITPESFDAAVQAVSHFHQPALPVAFHEGRAIHLGPRGRGEDHPLPDRAGQTLRAAASCLLPPCQQTLTSLRETLCSQLIPTALSRLLSTLVDDNIHVSPSDQRGKTSFYGIIFLLESAIAGISPSVCLEHR